MGEHIKRFKESVEYKKWKIARFFTLYCDSPTEPEEITEETVIEFEKIFSGETDNKDLIDLNECIKPESKPDE
jgi:hypothetical protein